MLVQRIENVVPDLSGFYFKIFFIFKNLTNFLQIIDIVF